MSNAADFTHHVSLRNLQPSDTLRIVLSFATLYVLFNIGTAVYNAYFGPLSGYPGPTLRKFSRIPRVIVLIRGVEAEVHPRLHEKYGPVVRIAPNELVYAAGAQAWKDIDGFKKPGQPKVFKDPFMYGKPFNKTDALITANDANHARQRKLVSHAFSDRSLRDLEPMLKKWCGEMVKKLSTKATGDEKVDLLKYYNCTTFDIMGDLSFNEGLNMLEEGEYSSWVKAIFLGIKSVAFLRGLKLLGSWGTWLVDEHLMNNPKVRVKQAEHWNYSKERVERRLQRTPEHPDLWSKILEKSSGPGGLTREEHHSFAALFMVAGTETTATALSGVTYYLLRNPDYMRKLTQEIRDSHSSYEDMSLESVARLKYLQAVLQEGLRMYPPVPTNLGRVVPKGGAEICGQFVPEDTRVSVHQFSTYRNEKHFKKAWEFHPERWLGDAEFADDNLDAVEPFGVGPRNCVGKNLAWHEMRLLLAATLLHFDVELCSESDDWSDQRVFLLWEKRPLMCRLTLAGK